MSIEAHLIETGRLRWSLVVPGSAGLALLVVVVAGVLVRKFFVVMGLTPQRPAHA